MSRCILVILLNFSAGFIVLDTLFEFVSLFLVLMETEVYGVENWRISLE